MAAHRVYPELNQWFQDYKVLGDDIVISDARVAKVYLELMQTDLEVTINRSKSLTSVNGTWEFAKCFIYRGVNLSPFSWAELKLLPTSLAAILALFLKNRRQAKYNISSMIRILGFGYRVSSRLNSGYLRLLRKHPKVVPPLLFLTFPETSPSSLPSFSDWMRAFSLNLLLPLDSLKGIAGTFREEYVRRTLKVLAATRFTSEPILNMFPRQGQGAAEVLRDMCSQLDKKFAAMLSLECQKVFLAQFSPRKASVSFGEWTYEGSPSKGVPPEDVLLNIHFCHWADLIKADDSYPHWIEWESRPDTPREIDRVGRWVRYKLKTLLYLQRKGKLFPAIAAPRAK